jgi:hypothetical protein
MQSAKYTKKPVVCTGFGRDAYSSFGQTVKNPIIRFDISNPDRTEEWQYSGRYPMSYEKISVNRITRMDDSWLYTAAPFQNEKFLNDSI